MIQQRDQEHRTWLHVGAALEAIMRGGALLCEPQARREEGERRSPNAARRRDLLGRELDASLPAPPQLELAGLLSTQ